MNINIIDLAPLLTDVKQCIAFMRGRNLLLQDFYCCRNRCSKVMDVSITDKEWFQCNTCKKRVTIRKNSFFEKSKLELPVLLAIIYFFANSSSVSECVKYLKRKASCMTVIQSYNYLRDIMTTYLARNIVRFRNNTTVHCDKSFIGGKRKYNKGRIPNVKPRYVF